eukprot:m.38224 g.38224  ORF g.38224 m.38224 type:complete len:360 (+) comp32539_c0_seq5:24-1103(+)
MAQVIDGSVLEGGGQILRIALALAPILQKPIEVIKIRLSRDKPGLKPQHLAGLRLVTDMCRGKVTGDRQGSQECTLHPGILHGGTYVADPKTAGSVSLLLQAALPCSLFGKTDFHLTLKGGTNAKMAPQIDFTALVFKPIAEKFGVHFDCFVKRRGFYPRGQGEVVISGSPVTNLLSVTLTDRGDIRKITGRAFVAGKLPIKIAERMKIAAMEVLRKRHSSEILIEIEIIKETSASSIGDGTGIILVAETTTGCLLAGSQLGERGVSAEEVGSKAADMLMQNLDSGGCVDEYLQDQLIVFMALAEGRSTIKTGPLTLHTETAIHVVELMTGVKFDVTTVDKEKGTKQLSCLGIAIKKND